MRKQTCSSVSNTTTSFMWSNQYLYFYIQSDAQHRLEVDARHVADWLMQTGNFKQTGKLSFCHTEHFPWIQLDLVFATNGNYAQSTQHPTVINHIAAVCAKDPGINPGQYLEVLLALAGHLNWKLYLEEDDEGNENIEIISH